MGHGPSEEVGLRDYLGVARRRKWTIVATTMLVGGTALAVAVFETPRYRASAELLISPKGSETLFSPDGGAVFSDPRRAVATEIKVLTSSAVEDQVARRLGSTEQVTASGSPEDNVVTVRAVDEDPQRAAEIVNTYIASYIAYRREASVQDSANAQAEILRKVEEKQRQIELLDAQPGPRDTPDRVAERTSLVNQQNLFREQLDQLQVSASLNSGGAQLITPGTAPDDPFEPRPVRSAITSLVLGLMVGTALAFLIDYFDEALRTIPDVERATQGLAVLGVIPLAPRGRNAQAPGTVTRTDPGSPAAEAYRSLRTSIQFLSLDAPLATLQLTSARSSEGKTSTVTNLAVAMADTGQRVVLVDCDLRRSRAHEFFGLSNELGFTSVLLGELPLSAALQDVPGVKGLRLLASGPRPPNPSELLSGRRAEEVLSAVRADADVVLIDSPPVLPVSDAVALAARVDATLVVVDAASTKRKSVQRAMELLRRVDAPVIGAVLNCARAEDAYGYGYGYGAVPTPRADASRAPSTKDDEGPTKSPSPALAGPGRRSEE